MGSNAWSNYYYVTTVRYVAPAIAGATYTRERPLTIQWYRDAVFDGISHSEAFNLLDIGVRPVQWLHYYQAPVLLPEQCDVLYGVEPRTTDRLIRNFQGRTQRPIA